MSDEGLWRAARDFIELHDADEHADATWPCDGQCRQARALRAALAARSEPDHPYTTFGNGDVCCPVPEAQHRSEPRGEGLREDRHQRLHPDDGYAYDGCEGFACRTLRAALAPERQESRSVQRRLAIQRQETPLADKLTKALYIKRWGEWPPRDGMDSPMLSSIKLDVKEIMEYMND